MPCSWGETEDRRGPGAGGAALRVELLLCEQAGRRQEDARHGHRSSPKTLRIAQRRARLRLRSHAPEMVPSGWLDLVWALGPGDGNYPTACLGAV